jgi:hypothetical protein
VRSMKSISPLVGKVMLVLNTLKGDMISCQ